MEYGTVILLAAAILAGVVLFIPPAVSNGVESAVCRLMSLMGADCGKDEPAPEEAIDYSPGYCTRTVDQHNAGWRADIGFIHLGQEYTFAVARLSDDSILVTSMPQMEGGVTAAAGYDFGDNHGANASGNLEGNISGRLAAGSSFLFKNEDEYEHFKEELHTYLSRENQKTFEYDSGLAVALADTIDPPEIPEPYIRTSTVEAEGSFGGGLGLWTSDPDKRSEKKGDYENKDDGGTNLNLGAQGSVAINEKVDISQWNDIGTSHTYSWSAEGNLGSNVLSHSTGGGASWSGATRILRDENGELINVRYSTVTTTRTSEGTEVNGAQGNSGNSNYNENGGKVKDGEGETQRTTQAVQLDFNTPAEQEMGERMLEERGLLPPANVLDYAGGYEGDPLETATSDSEAPAEEPGPDAPDWERHAYERGRIWRSVSDDTVDQTELSASLKMGLQFGLSANWGSDQRRTREAQILGPPNGGRRVFEDYQPCVAKPGE